MEQGWGLCSRVQTGDATAAPGSGKKGSNAEILPIQRRAERCLSESGPNFLLLKMAAESLASASNLSFLWYLVAAAHMLQQHVWLLFLLSQKPHTHILLNTNH